MNIRQASVLFLAVAAATACSSHANQPKTSEGSLPAAAQPSEPTVATESDRDFYLRVSDRLARVDPYVSVERVRTSARDGWREVHLFSENGGDQLAYVSDDLKTMFLGDMIDLETGVSITDFSALSVRSDLLEEVRESAISYPARDEIHELFVFTQPDCAECVLLHEDLPQLNAAGISVQYLAFPAEGMETPAAQQLSAAWCSPDARVGVGHAMAGEIAGAAGCEDTIASHFGLGLRLGVQASPTIVSAAGGQVEGYPGVEALIAALEPGEG